MSTSTPRSATVPFGNVFVTPRSRNSGASRETRGATATGGLPLGLALAQVRVGDRGRGVEHAVLRRLLAVQVVDHELRGLAALRVRLVADRSVDLSGLDRGDAELRAADADHDRLRAGRTNGVRATDG